MMSSANNNDDDFVTKTAKHRKKTSNNGSDNTPKKPPTGSSSGTSSTTPAAAAAGSSTPGAAPAAGGDSISLRPRTMFAMKGRGRTESEGSAYRPQWSKDGEGFVSASSSKDAGGKDGDPNSRRKSKVLRYTKEELLALHFTTTSPPKFPPDTPVASEHALPPVGTLPFDYEEIYKQWSLNRNRGRGRGRGAAAGNNQSSRGSHDRSRGDGKDDSEWDKHGKRDDGQHHDQDDLWERGAKPSESSRGGGDMWDDVGALGSDSNEMDLASMAEAAEKFRREMDAMREQLKEPASESASPDDFEAFDKKLEDAVAAGQFEDSDEEEAPWDDPVIEKESGIPSGDQAVSHVQERSSQAQPDAGIFEALEPLSSTSAFGLEEKPAFSLSALRDEPQLPGLNAVQFQAKDEWFYLDPQGLQQGPFKTAEMREWFEAGYFKPHLPIRFGREGGFTPLANQFVHGQMPFADPIPPARPSEQERLLEFQREQQRLQQQQQQQHQQLLELQRRQQQEQQRLLQLNQEEKIRMEMQRLEIARQQQQSHIFQQQQQLLHHQQQHQHQQQQQQQQQHMLLQQQTSWQRSQREGIMSALGMFGNGQGNAGVEQLDNFRSEHLQPQYQADLRAHHNIQAQGSRSVPHDPVAELMNNNGAWPGSAAGRGSLGDTLGLVGELRTSISEKPPSPLGGTAWGKASMPSESSFSLHDEKQRSSDISTARDSNAEQVVHPEETSAQTFVAQKESREVPQSRPTKSPKQRSKAASPPKKPQAENAPKPESAWGAAEAPASGATTASKKSLKEIQEEEQRELRSRMDEAVANPENLAQMGAQLKMMLGVQPGQAPPSAPAPPRASTPAPSAVATGPAPNAWGAPVAGPVATAGKKHSMRDILAEEERLAHERARKTEGAPSSSHWVNVVSGNPVAAAAIPKPAARSLGPVPASVLKSRQQARASNGEPVAQKKTAASPARAETDASFWNFGAGQSSGAPSSGSSATSANAFGGSHVSAEFMAWASKQLQGIDRNANVTLLEYCASVEDPGEIREYLAAYLGSTPRVSAFATEFIQRKKKSPSGPGAKQQGSGSPVEAGDATSKRSRRRGKKSEQ